MSVTDHSNEPALIKRILSGEEQLYSVLVERYQTLAYNIALSIVENKEDAEEVAHDGFLKAYKSLGNFKFDSKFSTWLYRIVYHTAISHTRKKKLKRESVKTLQKLEAAHTDTLESNDRSHYIKLAMAQLEKDDQQILQLFYLKEMALDEISDITGTSVNTLKVRLHRSRKKMATKLQELLQGEAVHL
jgi:RNA polymerase sigma-70 factor (ECF subfamily)